MKCEDLGLLWEERGQPGAAAELEQHLRACAGCRERAAELEPTSHWLLLLTQEAPAASNAFWPRLREQLEAADRRRDFSAVLVAFAQRAAAVLAAVVLLLTVGVLQESAESGVAEFDAPQTYLGDVPGSPGPANGQLDRDQVVLTLVARAETPR
jgi:hypothetical protein